MAEIFFEVFFSKWVLNGSEGWNTLFFTQFNDFWVFWRHLSNHKCKKWPKQVIFSLPDFFQMTYRVDIYCFWLIVWSKSAIDWLSARSASILIKPQAIWVLNFIRANGRWRTLVIIINSWKIISKQLLMIQFGYDLRSHLLLMVKDNSSLQFFW